MGCRVIGIQRRLKVELRRWWTGVKGGAPCVYVLLLHRRVMGAVLVDDTVGSAVQVEPGLTPLATTTV